MELQKLSPNKVPDLLKRIFNFLKSLEKLETYSPHTKKAYAVDLGQFFHTLHPQIPYKEVQFFLLHPSSQIPFFTDLNPLSPQEESLLIQNTKKTQLKWSHLSLSTKNRKYSSLKSFFNWLYQSEFSSINLGKNIICPKIPPKIPHYLSLDEALHLFQFLEKHLRKKPNALKARALFYLLYGGGLRVSEACTLKWENVDLKKTRIKVLGKGQKERFVHLPQKTLHALDVLSPKTKYVFGSSPLKYSQAYQWVKRWGAQAGLKTPLTPHALRHSFATHLLSSGAQLRILQEILGHSSLKSTEKYLHLSIDQLAQTLELKHPLGDGT